MVAPRKSKLTKDTTATTLAKDLATAWSKWGVGVLLVALWESPRAHSGCDRAGRSVLWHEQLTGALNILERLDVGSAGANLAAITLELNAVLMLPPGWEAVEKTQAALGWNIHWHLVLVLATLLGEGADTVVNPLVAVDLLATTGTDWRRVVAADYEWRALEGGSEVVSAAVWGDHSRSVSRG